MSFGYGSYPPPPPFPHSTALTTPPTSSEILTALSRLKEAVGYASSPNGHALLSPEERKAIMDHLNASVGVLAKLAEVAHVEALTARSTAGRKAAKVTYDSEAQIIERMRAEIEETGKETERLRAEAEAEEARRDAERTRRLSESRNRRRV